MVEQQAAVRIRFATHEDARRIAEVHVASWRDAYRGLVPDDYLDRLSVEDREVQWLAALADPERTSGALVAEEDGRIVGFASFSPSRDEDASRRTGEVPAIYVEPSAVGTGVGRELFAAVGGALRDAGFDRATLWVLQANERARRFYERAGWTWDGTIRDHQFDCANEAIVRYTVELGAGSPSTM